MDSVKEVIVMWCFEGRLSDKRYAAARRMAMMRSFSVTYPTLSRIGPSRRMVMVLILPLIASLVLTGRAAARNEVATDTETGDTITITVNVELAQSNFEEWEKKLHKAFKKCLGDPEGFQTGCKKLFFKLEIVPARPTNERKYHAVRIKDVPEGEYEKSSVHSISIDDPTTRDFIALWDTNDDEATICHEFMHMLGLHDEYVNLKRGPTGKRFTVPDPNKAPEYTWTDSNGNGRVDRGDRNGNGMVDRGVDDTRELDSVHLKPNERPSIMAEQVDDKKDKGWGILKRHITEILDKHHIDKCGRLTRADTPEISVYIDSSFRVEECGEDCYDHTHKFSTTIKGKKIEWEGKTRGNCKRCWYNTNGNGSCPVSCDDLKRGEKVQCKGKTLYGEQTITLPPEPIEEYRRAFCGEERVGQVQPDLHSQGADRPELLLPVSRWNRAASDEAEHSAALPVCHNVRAEVQDATLR